MANYDSSPITPLAESFFSAKHNHLSHTLRSFKLHARAFNELVQHNGRSKPSKQQFRWFTSPFYTVHQAHQHAYFLKSAGRICSTNYIANSCIRTIYVHHKLGEKLKQSMVYYRVIN